ncbi:MAG: cupin domain-containing protein [Hyphomonas sp.]|uniref:cupin domain-containing protein n=1 Tax=Hyphomonas sp. TaxID=87 RepID=UPI0017B96F2F|nr:cupin domain-containing protein [Hyphomonas sp.]MBU3921165.1 cupin domain-containing protein [Alphaproteobacteria bacterium]MBA3067356.1 cupin domain-containing protein [Hyphomonas sp.]MBU4063045.1 cupin domain-containing protein [Alphaproteobacteria bacterium]MBU4163626.1 cupin domain-containing protein [Alphaproteobacteria bacterium]MBU4568633.1 cupin domain-containing protein [Alphaproteobacteria bacterium]
MSETSLTPHAAPAAGYEIYRTSTAPTLDETAHMEVVGMNPEFEAGITRALEAGFAEGNVVKTLFSRPGFSLTYAWFKSGFPLPLHTHDADCLYYIVAGTLQLGTDTLGAGDGFFLPADKAYRYTPGPDGVEVLEFRGQENFNINFLAKSLPAWEKIAKSVSERRADWTGEVAPSSALHA